MLEKYTHNSISETEEVTLDWWFPAGFDDFSIIKKQ